MNRKFFGDTRDLFKLDLVCHIMKNLPELDNFTFVPMLTEDDKAPGRRKSVKTDLGKAEKNGKAGSKNKDLIAQMARLQEIDDDTEYFRGIQSLFKKQNTLMIVFDQPRFSHENRTHYFNTLLEKFPDRSLIFLDPDIGLEVKNPTRRHLLLEEVRKIHERMDMHSFIMIYQHIPQVIRPGYIRNRCDQLASVAGISPISITDNEIVFFFLSKNPALKTNLEVVLGEYMSHYPVLSAFGEW